MKKQAATIVFVVLTYRNTSDLKDFIKSTQEKIKEKYQIVVVNSFYDYESNQLFKEIAESNGCDFLEVANKGYGFGNNRGVEYAINKYTFKFLIISNPDIEIRKFDYSIIKDNTEVIYAPNIKTKKGKNQNPYYPYELSIIHKLMYKGFLKNNKRYIYSAIILNKILRIFFLLKISILKSKFKAVYASHGSFIIFGNQAIEKLYPIYLEKMFLFSEESYLAFKAEKMNVPTYYLPKIQILHKEDGSINLTELNVNSHAKESYLIFSEFVNKEKNKE